MNKETFNRYCAKVMGYEKATPPEGLAHELWVCNHGSGRWKYNPYQDLNQASEVFDALMAKEEFMVIKFHYYSPGSSVNVRQVPIKEAIRNFIISTMPDKGEG